MARNGRSFGRLGITAVVFTSVGCGSGALPGVDVPRPAAAGSYDVWVASEAVDEIALVRFDGSEARVLERRNVGAIPVEIDAPHGVAVSPDGRYVYVTLGHGQPNGTLLKIEADTRRIVGRTPLGLFPATVALTPDGEYAFVSNFNLHGDHVPSSISMVHLPTMAEIARTETCVMPHGSRVNPQGTRHYSVCMMDEQLVEIDARTGSVMHRFSLRRGREGHAEHTPAAAGAQVESCSPTWAEPSADGSTVFVTCSRAREVLEIDVERWAVARRFGTGENPYNLGVTPDGRFLLVTLRNRTDPALEVHDLRSGEAVGRVPASTTLAHGVAVTADSRFAFVTVEGVGSEPGRLDVIDLGLLRRVATAEVGQQATGVALVPPGR